MWPVPAPGPQAPPVVVRSSSSSPSDSLIQSSADSFLKVKGDSFDWIQFKGNSCSVSSILGLTVSGACCS